MPGFPDWCPGHERLYSGGRGPFVISASGDERPAKWAKRLCGAAPSSDFTQRGFGYDGFVSTRHHASPGPAAPEAPEPSLAERARTLLSIGRIGSLSTHSQRFPGFPFGSMVPYASDEMGRPIFFVSSLAMHTQNLQQDPRGSLLITQPDVAGDPLGSARLTVLGNVAEAPAAEVQDLYLSRYENARYWAEFTDFAYYRLRVSGVYFIGGFGVMGWISPEEYAVAQPDPLAEAAAGIIQHMNADHADALRLIARRFAGEEADEAAMTAVDRLGFNLRLTSGERVHGCRVAFLQEARSVEGARRVLVEMTRQSRPEAERK
jgi:putative heme iron utilization protein